VTPPIVITGELIFNAADPGDRLSIVVRGRLDAFRMRSGEGEHQVGTFEDVERVGASRLAQIQAERVDLAVGRIS
jgi:hypothetical protein